MGAIRNRIGGKKRLLHWGGVDPIQAGDGISLFEELDREGKAMDGSVGDATSPVSGVWSEVSDADGDA